MSFMPADAPEFEEVRQRHDEWMEIGRQEMLAEAEHGERLLRELSLKQTESADIELPVAPVAQN